MSVLNLTNLLVYQNCEWILLIILENLMTSLELVCDPHGVATHSLRNHGLSRFSFKSNVIQHYYKQLALF
jgi:hypothetical protein